MVPAELFGLRPGEPFQQLFGLTGLQTAPATGTVDLVGPTWLAAIRTRAALRRADGTAPAHLYALRDALVALIGARTGAPVGHLPVGERDRIRETIPSSKPVALWRAFGEAVQILDQEFEAIAPQIGDAVALPLLEEIAH